MVIVGAALLAALLAVPRPVEPDLPPMPSVDRLEQRRSLEALEARARASRREPLPFDVRATGEWLRRYGAAIAAGDERTARSHLQAARSAAYGARRRHGDEALLRLEAVQNQLFRAALRRWEATAVASTDLTELGGDFLQKARENGWLADDGRLDANRAERAVLFKMRWVELTGLEKDHPFLPTLNEWRAYYRFLLTKPPGRTDQERAQRQLDYVTALSRKDPSFPAALARGVLLYRMADYPRAAVAFRAHLAAHPSGPWSLRARNYLAQTLATR